MNVINYLKEKAKSYIHEGNVCDIADIVEEYNSELMKENKMLRSKISRIRKALGDELNKSDNPTNK
jgi:hypothetical protein